MTREQFLASYYSKYGMINYVHFIVLKIWTTRRKLELNAR